MCMTTYMYVHVFVCLCTCSHWPVCILHCCVRFTLSNREPPGKLGKECKEVYVQTSPDTMCLLTLFTYKVQCNSTEPGYLLHLHRYQSMVVEKVLLQDSFIFDIITPPNGETGLSVCTTGLTHTYVIPV